MPSKKNKILCAMSGGVDSSVAALFLQQKGFEVIGIFMNFWSDIPDNDICRQNKCCSSESAMAARVVAAKLKIKLYELNLKDIFKSKVVDYFIKAHEEGTTPNPCVVCNREIKFKRLLKIANDLNINKIATGHYARIIRKNNIFELHRGTDKLKDQSYFLWHISPSILKSIEFPIGIYNKNKVRKIAKFYNLETHNKKDSQGLCFIGGSKSSFIAKYAKTLLKPGNVVDNLGNIIGKHKGLAYYTIGQREGFTITNYKRQVVNENTPPLYVIKLISSKNLLVVGKNNDVFNESMTVSDLNWFDSSYISFGGKKSVRAQIRYQHAANKCTITYLERGILNIKFNTPQRAITPGQSCVFYKKDRVLGGGLIKK